VVVVVVVVIVVGFVPTIVVIMTGESFVPKGRDGQTIGTIDSVFIVYIEPLFENSFARTSLLYIFFQTVYVSPNFFYYNCGL